VDVYCGVGFFALELANLVESYAGIELDQPAIRAARRNAAARGRTNGEFVSGTAEEWLPPLLQRFPAHKTAVLLDPPRKGCAPSVIQLLRDVRPAQVLYVSCHPATLARDLNVLCRDGVFHLVNVTPLDMFPQTQHVECIADLRCRQPDMAAS
jgi:23S rRNA (uracil1939-C5)-methyltransferase